MIRALFFVLGFALTLMATKVAFADQVITCNDGDTCRILGSSGTVKVRIWGIEAPESAQLHGAESRDFLFQLLSGRELDLRCTGEQHGNRKICRILIGNLDVGREMVRAGQAFETAHFSGGAYTAAQKEARINRRGIWGTPGMQSPLCFKFNPPECAQDPMYQP